MQTGRLFHAWISFAGRRARTNPGCSAEHNGTENPGHAPGVQQATTGHCPCFAPRELGTNTGPAAAGNGVARVPGGTRPPDGFVRRAETSRIREHASRSAASPPSSNRSGGPVPPQGTTTLRAFSLWRTPFPGSRSPVCNPLACFFIFSAINIFPSENRARREIFRVKKIFVGRPLCAQPSIFRGEMPRPRVFSSAGSSPRSRNNVVHPKSDGKLSNSSFNLFDGLSGDSH